MPGSCSVRGRHNYGDTADDESHQSAHHAEMTGCLKALEGEEIVQEIAEPDAQGETDEKRYVPHALERCNSLPESLKGGFHLIIYRKFLEQEVQQDEDGYAANGSNDVSRGSKLVQNAFHAGASLVEEIEEHRYLQEKNAAGNEQNQQRVDDALSYHGAQGLGE